jgi:hypothetical protein
LLAAQTDYLADISSGLAPQALITKLDNSVTSGEFSTVLSKASGLAVGVVTIDIKNVSPTSAPTQVPIQQAVVEGNSSRGITGVTMTVPHSLIACIKILITISFERRSVYTNTPSLYASHSLSLSSSQGLPTRTLAAIIGGVVGGIIICSCIFFGVWYAKCRKAKAKGPTKTVHLQEEAQKEDFIPEIMIDFPRMSEQERTIGGMPGVAPPTSGPTSPAAQPASDSIPKAKSKSKAKAKANQSPIDYDN